MAVRDLIPWGRDRSSVPSTMQHSEEGNPFLSLHREMNRLFDDAFSRIGGGAPSLLATMPSWSGASWPTLEVNASDKDVRVSAELPGIDEKDIEVLVDDDVLTIRGEKKSETEDAGRGFSERWYGRFERSIALPFEVEDERAEASFKNGVLTVTLPKSPAAQQKVKRIAINGK